MDDYNIPKYSAETNIEPVCIENSDTQICDSSILFNSNEAQEQKAEPEINPNCSSKHVEIKETITIANEIPDGGWGWVVVLSSFLIHCIADGITYSFGVLTPYFIETYGISRETVGWLSSVMVGLTYCTGPVASLLTDRFGFRAVTIAGAILSGLGYGGIYWYSELWFVFATAAVMAGSGFGLMYLPAIVSINVYFHEKMSLALGLAVCGSGFGTFAFCPLIEYLVTRYSLKGSMLISGAIILNCIPCGMVLLPPDKAPIKTKSQRSYKISNSAAESQNESASVKQSSFKKEYQRSSSKDSNKTKQPYQAWNKSEQEELIRKYVSGTNESNPQIATDGFVNYKRRRSTSMNPNHEIEITLSDCDSPIRIPDTNGSLINPNGGLTDECIVKSLPDIRTTNVVHNYYPPIRTIRSKNASLIVSHPYLFMSSRQSIMSSCSNLHSHHLKSASDSNESLKKAHTSHEKNKKGPFSSLIKSLKKLFDIDLFCDPVFIMLSASNILTSLGFIAPYLFLKDRAVKENIDSYKASMLISVIGIGNTFGRIFFGVLSLISCVNTLQLYNTSLLLCGVFTMLSAYFKTYELMVFYSAMYGIFTGVYVTLTSVVLADMLGKEKLSQSFGLILLFQGIATFGGPPLVGYVYDVTSNYDTAFHLCGFIVGLSGLILYPLPCLQKCLKKRKSNPKASLK